MIAGQIARLRVLGAPDVEIAQESARLGVALTVDELRRIAERLGRDPTSVEAHAFAAQWSEHCSYKSSRNYLARLPTDGPDVILGPGEDSGIVRLGEWNGASYGIVVAHESHNHPSQVVPFEGAATGIGGIVRDVLCMGAEVIGVADPLRFGPLDDPHCRYVAQGVVDGIAAYGNAIGVPNVGGDVYIHAGFRDNCLVNVVALGLVKEADVIHSAAPAGSAGWDIVLVGKATDRSGFGGAAFSSLVLDDADADANKGAVQVPDPFLKSVIMRASYRAFAAIRERGLTVGFKDLGAGGIMGCTAELVAAGGFGATIDLDRCPTSQPNLPPEVIAVGETQERLAWVVPPAFTPALLAIYNDEFGLPQVARGAGAAVIGTVAASDEFVMRAHGEDVLRVPIAFLASGVRYERPCVLPATSRDHSAQPHGEAMPLADAGGLLAQVLAHRDVCSRRAIYERFDGVVRGVTAIPAGFADAGVLAPVPGSPLAMALAVDGNPRYGLLDPQRSAELAVCESVCNVVAVGARPIGLTDCLNFGNPEDPRQMGEFAAAVDGLAHAARELGVAFVSGNVSLYNQSSSGRSVPPSPIVACVGALHDISLTITPEFKAVGSALYLLSAASSDLGGSVVAELLALDATAVPRVDYPALRAAIATIGSAHADGLVRGVHDRSDGGLLVALCEMSFAAYVAAGTGIGFARGAAAGRASLADFSEGPGFVVEVSDADRFERVAAANGARFERVGATIAQADAELYGERIALGTLHRAWEAPLADFYEDAK